MHVIITDDDETNVVSKTELISPQVVLQKVQQ